MHETTTTPLTPSVTMGCSFSYHHTVVSPTSTSSSIPIIHKHCVDGQHVENHSRSPPLDIPIPDWLADDIRGFRHQLVTSPDFIRTSYRHKLMNLKPSQRDDIECWKHWFQRNFLTSNSVELSLSNDAISNTTSDHDQPQQPPLVIPGWEVPVVAQCRGTPIYGKPPYHR